LKKLSPQFYRRKDVTAIAKDLLWKILVTKFDGMLTSGRIVETEAYVAFTDKASHSFGGKRTQRNEHMYAEAATSYVYICYGMHHLFNVVTNQKDIPDAVLIRAVEPLEGIDAMMQRTGKKRPDSSITKGPGNMSCALGISKIHSGILLTGDEIFIAGDEDIKINNSMIGSSSRIGIDGAGEDALLPYRFYIRGNKFVSGSPVK
jgi:DNA-3-methyladenine glycosylase